MVVNITVTKNKRFKNFFSALVYCWLNKIDTKDLFWYWKNGCTKIDINIKVNEV